VPQQYVTESAMCYSEILTTATKYNIHCLDVSVGQTRHRMWKTFADSIVQLFSEYVF